MMIRINLLPSRQVKKRENSKQFLILAAAALVLAIGANAYWYMDREGERAMAEKRLKDTRAKIAEKDKQIGEVGKINTRRKEVQQKLDVLTELKARRTGPVKMMDAISTIIPERVWINSFGEVKGQLNMNGSATNLDEVSEFMRGLKEVVWTRRGMARIVEQKRDAKTLRVELLDTSEGEAGTLRDFPVAEVSPLFSGVELKSTKQTKGSKDSATPGVVDFQVTMKANEAI